MPSRNVPGVSSSSIQTGKTPCAAALVGAIRQCAPKLGAWNPRQTSRRRLAASDGPRLLTEQVRLDPKLSLIVYLE